MFKRDPGKLRCLLFLNLEKDVPGPFFEVAFGLRRFTGAQHHPVVVGRAFFLGVLELPVDSLTVQPLSFERKAGAVLFLALPVRALNVVACAALGSGEPALRGFNVVGFDDGFHNSPFLSRVSTGDDVVQSLQRLLERRDRALPGLVVDGSGFLPRHTLLEQTVVADAPRGRGFNGGAGQKAS